jgi:hypothetical protein
MSRNLLITICFTIVVISACGGASNSNSAPATPSPKSNALLVADSEGDFQQEDDFPNTMRAEVRETVTDTVKAKLPSWTIKGIATEPYQHNVFWVAVDIEKAGKSVVINLVVKRFFPESGNAYWKAILANESLKQQLHNMNDAQVWKKLNEATDEIETLKNPPAEDEGERPDPY